MIKHLLRQEREGGYWLIRDSGRAIELDEFGYRLMARLHETGGSLQQRERAHLTNAVRLNNGNAVLTEMTKQGLDEPENWRTVRHAPRDAPATSLPRDAVVAPKRIYFEITRGCNLSCHTCFNNSHHKLPDELTREEILDVNLQAYDLGVFEIRYTGGECTTVPGFADIVADARRRGFYISIGTNGVYTDEQLE
ncbi:MAG: radical SAM protein, partial [Blastocatellia bacterium]